MKKLIKLSLVLCVAALAFSSCNCYKKMSKASDVSYKSNPEMLVLNNGEVSTDLTVTFPAKYFSSDATLRITPILMFDGGQVEGASKYLQGDKVKDNYAVVTKDGGKYTQHISFPYDSRMKNSELYVKLEVKCCKSCGVKNAFELINASTYKPLSKEEKLRVENDKPFLKSCYVKIADGVNTLQSDIRYTDYMQLSKDNFKRVETITDKAELLYKIGSAAVENKSLKSESINDLKERVAKNKGTKTEISELYVSGYASPDGPEKFNDKLAGNRSESSKKAIEKLLKDSGIKFDATGYGEDWDGFQELVENSSIKDRELILQILTMCDSPAEREAQIRNLASVYGDLKSEVLPKLRRSQIVNTTNIEGKSDAEMLAIIANGTYDQLNLEELLFAAQLVDNSDKKVEVLSYAAKKYNDARAYNNLSVAYVENGDVDSAIAALNEASKLGLTSTELNNNLALANLAKNNVSEAAKYASSANAQTKSLVLAAQGDYKSASASLTGYNAAVVALMNDDLNTASNAISADQSAEADYLRAIIATRKGDMNAAGASLNGAVAKNAALKEKAMEDVNLKKLFNSGFKF